MVAEMEIKRSVGNLTDEQVEKLDVLEAALYATLQAHYVKTREVVGSEALVFDEDGPSAFVVIALNKVTSIDLLPSDAKPDEKEAAVSCATNLITQKIAVSERGTIGPAEAIKAGIHVTAGSLLLSALQGGAIMDCLKLAQKMVLDHHHKKRGMH